MPLDGDCTLFLGAFTVSSFSWHLLERRMIKISLLQNQELRYVHTLCECLSVSTLFSWLLTLCKHKQQLRTKGDFKFTIQAVEVLIAHFHELGNALVGLLHSEVWIIIINMYIQMGEVVQWPG